MPLWVVTYSACALSPCLCRLDWMISSPRARIDLWAERGCNSCRERLVLLLVGLRLAAFHTCSKADLIAVVTGYSLVSTALWVARDCRYRSSGGTPASFSIAATGVLLYAPRTLLRHLFCVFTILSILDGAIGPPPASIDQIGAPYVIIGREIVVYSSLDFLTDGPQVDAVIRAIDSNAAIPLATALSI